MNKPEEIKDTNENYLINDFGVRQFGKIMSFDDIDEFHILVMNPFQPIYGIRNIQRFLGFGYNSFNKRIPDYRAAGIIKKIRSRNGTWIWRFIPYLWMMYEKKAAIKQYEERTKEGINEKE